MSKPFTTVIRSLPSPFQLLPSSVASGSRSFSCTPPAQASRARRISKIRKRTAHLERRATLDAIRNAGTVDPVLGYVIPDAGPSRADWRSPWDGCRLQKTLLRAENIYDSPLPDYSTGESPTTYLPGLNKEDQELLFGALPHTAVDLRVASMPGQNISNEVRTQNINDAAQEQARKVEVLQRILDLRNASKAGIEVANRQRVIEEFGRKEEGAGEDTGSPEVQAALLTQRIRSVAEHINSNPGDNQNKRSLRMLVHERAKILKYYKKTQQPESYSRLLLDLGLEPRAVEGEITLPF